MTGAEDDEEINVRDAAAGQTAEARDARLSPLFFSPKDTG